MIQVSRFPRNLGHLARLDRFLGPKSNKSCNQVEVCFVSTEVSRAVCAEVQTPVWMVLETSMQSADLSGV